MKRTIVGMILGLSLLYVSVKDMSFDAVMHDFSRMHYVYLVPALLLSMMTLLLRSLRWGYIIAPFQLVPQRQLFPITCIGFMAIALMPLRTGELMRPYLLATKTETPLSSAVATIFVERVLDAFVMIGMMLLVILFADFPPLVIRSGYVLFTMFLIMTTSVCLLYFKSALFMKLVLSVTRRFPERIKAMIQKSLSSFIAGFSVIANPLSLLNAFLLSVCIWFLSGILIFSLFSFSNVHLPVVAAFAVLVITVIGISLPAAPGFIGNFQFGCIFALSLFHIEKSEALSFSLIYYVMGIGVNIAAGLLFLPFYTISIREMKKVFQYEQ